MAPLVWLITGTSSGFGRAFVESALAKGDKVIATARGDVSRLSHLKEMGAATLSLDLSAPQQSISAVVDKAVSIYGHIDVLVNNAGYIEGGVFEIIDDELLMRAWRNNVLGPLNLTRAVVAYMKPRKSGTLVFMGSVGAYYGAPGSMAYSGGKSAMEGMVPTIALELAAWNIRCTTLIPGYFRTDVMRKGNIKFEAPRHLPEYEEMNSLIQAGCYGAHGNQPGDPRKGADFVVDVVHGDGVALNKGWPDRLPLGPDGVKAVRDNCKAKILLCDLWEMVVSGTDLKA